MNQELQKILIESDLKDLIDDIQLGYFNDNQTNFEKARNRILEKICQNHLEIWASQKFQEIINRLNSKVVN